MTAFHLFAVVLFSAAFGAAAQGVWLWRVWRPADCRCPLHGTPSEGLLLGARLARLVEEARGAARDGRSIRARALLCDVQEEAARLTRWIDEHAPESRGGGSQPPKPAAAPAHVRTT